MKIDFNKITVLHDDGNIEEINPVYLSYEKAKEIVKNWLQTLSMALYTNNPEHRKLVFILDEEGRLRYKEPNQNATNLLREILGPGATELYGPVIICPKHRMFK